jgi:hypothetical protein
MNFTYFLQFKVLTWLPGCVFINLDADQQCCGYGQHHFVNPDKDPKPDPHTVRMKS